MVGSPKNLDDLRRVEASVQVTCNACGDVELIDRETLLHERTALGMSRDWQTVCADQSCRRCQSKDVRVLPVPFGQNSRELKQRRAENVLINLALQVLHDAAWLSTKGPVETPAVRLALRVLHPFLRDENLLREYWRGATEEPRRPWTSCHLPFRWIVTKLIERGYGVNAEFR